MLTCFLMLLYGYCRPGGDGGMGHVFACLVFFPELSLGLDIKSQAGGFLGTPRPSLPLACPSARR
jgi:hypothetical protein